MLKACIKISEDMIWNMMNSKKCVVKLGVKSLPNYVLIKLKMKMKVNIVFSTKAKTHQL